VAVLIEALVPESRQLAFIGNADSLLRRVKKRSARLALSRE
jgi:hypothetical protein